MAEAGGQGAGQELAITRQAGLVAAGTLGSRLVGAARDAVIAASFSVSSTDAFFVAFTIPNTLRQVLGEGAVAAAFIPVFSELDEKQGRAAAARYFARFAGAFGVLLVLASILGVLTAPLWTTAYAGGYLARDPAKFTLTVELTALVFPYVLFAGLAALQTGALNALGRFFLPALNPVFLNLCMIAAPWAFVPVALALGLPAIGGLALGALAGGLLQVLALAPRVRAVGLPLRPELVLRDPAVRASLARMAPLVLGTGVYQLNLLLSRLLASLLPSGAQSYLYYGQRLVEIPQGMLAMAVASAALPSLARLSQRRPEEAKAALRHSLALSLYLAVPASVALAALALPTVSVLFGRGEFGAMQVGETARSLVFMAAGVWAVAANQGLSRMFYAIGDTRTPVACSVVNLLCFLGFSLRFMGDFAHAAIAAANSFAAVVQLVLLTWLLRRSVGALGLRELLGKALRYVLASVAMALVARDIAALADFTRGGNDPRNLAIYALAVVMGVVAYVSASYLLGVRELGQILALLRRRTQGAS